MNAHRTLKRFWIATIIGCVVLLDITYFHGYFDENQRVSQFEDVRSCFLSELSRFSHHRSSHKNSSQLVNEMWKALPNITTRCGAEILSEQLHTVSLNNMDEKKLFIYPIDKSQTLELVTLGIGGDVTVEMQLNNKFPNINFYGADPFEETSHMYKPLGPVFQVGIAATNAINNLSVLIDGQYKNHQMKTITLPELLEQVNRPLIDFMLMDIEGAEYKIMPQLSGGEMDKWTICQLNMEVHGHISKYAPKDIVFTDLMYNFLKDSPYLPLHIEEIGHLRIFFINYKSRECAAKFWAQFISKIL